MLRKMGLAIGHPRRKHNCTMKQVVNDSGVKKQRAMKNGISDLPNELLITILSFMYPEEAAQTSLLSRRWRYLWYFTFDSLDFDPMDTTPEAAMRRQNFLRELKKLLKSFKMDPKKWIVLTTNADIEALRMMRNLDEEKKIYFTLGSNVKAKPTEFTRNLAEEMGIKKLRGSRLFLLENHTFLVVSRQKAIDLKFSYPKVR